MRLVARLWVAIAVAAVTGGVLMAPAAGYAGQLQSFSASPAVTPVAGGTTLTFKVDSPVSKPYIMSIYDGDKLLKTCAQYRPISAPVVVPTTCDAPAVVPLNATSTYRAYVALDAPATGPPVRDVRVSTETTASNPGWLGKGVSLAASPATTAVDGRTALTFKVDSPVAKPYIMSIYDGDKLLKTCAQYQPISASVVVPTSCDAPAVVPLNSTRTYRAYVALDAPGSGPPTNDVRVNTETTASNPGWLGKGESLTASPATTAVDGRTALTFKVDSPVSKPYIMSIYDGAKLLKKCAEYQPISAPVVVPTSCDAPAVVPLNATSTYRAYVALDAPTTGPPVSDVRVSTETTASNPGWLGKGVSLAASPAVTPVAGGTTLTFKVDSPVSKPYIMSIYDGAKLLKKCAEYQPISAPVVVPTSCDAPAVVPLNATSTYRAYVALDAPATGPPVRDVRVSTETTASNPGWLPDPQTGDGAGSVPSFAVMNPSGVYAVATFNVSPKVPKPYAMSIYAGDKLIKKCAEYQPISAPVVIPTTCTVGYSMPAAPADPVVDFRAYVALDAPGTGTPTNDVRLALRTSANRNPPLPLLAVHGWNGSGSDMDAVRDRGFGTVPGLSSGNVLRSKVSGTAGVEANADVIIAEAQQLSRASGGMKVNVIAHSKGGLDARVAMAKRPDLFNSLSMLATPNGGAVLADIACAYYANEPTNVSQPPVVFDTPCNGPEDALYDLQTGYVVNTLNPRFPNQPGLGYSVAAGNCIESSWDVVFDVTCKAASALLLCPVSSDKAVCVDSAFALATGSTAEGVNGNPHRRIGVFPYDHTGMREQPCVIDAALAHLYPTQSRGNSWLDGSGDCPMKRDSATPSSLRLSTAGSAPMTVTDVGGRSRPVGVGEARPLQPMRSGNVNRTHAWETVLNPEGGDTLDVAVLTRSGSGVRVDVLRPDGTPDTSAQVGDPVSTGYGPDLRTITLSGLGGQARTLRVTAGKSAGVLVLPSLPDRADSVTLETEVLRTTPAGRVMLRATLNDPDSQCPATVTARWAEPDQAPASRKLPLTSKAPGRCRYRATARLGEAVTVTFETGGAHPRMIVTAVPPVANSVGVL